MSEIIRPFDPRVNFTKIHNYVLDHMMPTLKPNSWKVLCYILRKTTGWGKDAEKIPYSQLLKGTGIASYSTLTLAIDELVTFGYVAVAPGDKWEANTYSLNTTLEIDTATGTVSTTETVTGATTVSVTAPTTETVGSKRKEIKKETSSNSQSATPPSTVAAAVKGSGEALPSSPQLPQDPPSPRKGKAPTHPLYQDTLATHKRLALEYEGTTNDKGETVCTSLSAHGRIATGIKAWCEAGLTPEQYETVYREVQNEGWLTGPLYPQLVLAKASKILRGRSTNGHSKHVSNGFESWLLTTWNMSSPSVVAMMEGISETELKQRYEIQKRGTP